jgi:hypothetical protein
LDIQEVLKGTPDYREFLTVDELKNSSIALADEFNHVEFLDIGFSSDGDKINAIRIDGGKSNALLFGFPHPNEPIGSMTLEYLSRLLAEDDELRNKLGYTWYIIKCIDPDGARLNEGWFKGKFSPLKYAQNYYRPPGKNQVEWTFPIDYKTLHFHNPLSETLALMRLIKEVKPKFMYSLHNAGFCGVYWYLGKGLPELYSSLHSLVLDEKLPLHMGEPETPFIKKLDDAIFQMFGVEESYDFIAEHSDSDPATIIKNGTSSHGYLKSICDGFTLVCEMPYYYDKRVTNDSPSDVYRRKAVIEGIEKGESLYHFLKPRFEKIAKKAERKTRLFSSVSDYLENFEARNEPRKKHAETTKEYEGKATIAQEFDSRVGTKFYSMLRLGMTLRVVDQTLAINTDKELTKVKEEIFCKLSDLNQELLNEAKIEVIPIKKLVKIQIGSGLMIAHHLANR